MTALVPPPAIRLVRRSTRGKAPAPPFGLKAFDDSAGAIAVALDAASDVAEIAAQLPDPEALAAGTLVVVLAETEGDGKLLGRLFRARPTVPRALRGSALLARGYARIGGEGDLVWAYVAQM